MPAVRFTAVSLLVVLYSSALFLEQLTGIDATALNWMAVVGTAVLIVLDRRSVVPVLRPARWMVVFVGLVLLSTLWSIAPGLSFRRGVLLVGATALGIYVAACYDLRQQAALYARVLVLTMIASIIVCLLLPEIGLHQDARQLGRWRGILDHKNLLGEWMALAVLMFVLLPHDMLQMPRALKFICGGIAVGVLTMTLSVTSITACVFVLVLFPFIRSLRWDHRLRSAVMLFLLAAGLVFGVWLAFNYGEVLDALGRTENLSGRSVIWPIIADQILDRPWLGYGYMSFFGEGSEYANTFFRGIWQPEHAHNVWLDVALDLGIIGLMLLLWILTRAIWQMLVMYTRLNRDSVLIALLFVMSTLSRSLTETFALRRRDLIWVMFVSILVAVAVEYQRTAVRTRRTGWVSGKAPDLRRSAPPSAGSGPPTPARSADQV